MIWQAKYTLKILWYHTIKIFVASLNLRCHLKACTKYLCDVKYSLIFKSAAELGDLKKSLCFDVEREHENIMSDSRGAGY